MNFITGIQIKYSNFSKTLEKAKESASSISQSTETLKKVFIKRIDIKKKSFTREKLFKRRKLELSRRREKEQKLETVPMTGKIGKSFSGILQKASSPFSAIMNTLGLLALGWLINNLPSIIKFVKDLYNRVVKIVDTLKSFITNLGNWFKNIGGVITAVKDNIINLDFTDSEGRLKNALEKLDKSFESMKNDIEEGKRLLTTPLGQEISGGSSNEAGETGPPVTGTNAEKYKQFYDMAQKAGAKYPALVAAQFALESGYGSAISGSNNYFGLKATDSESGAMKGTTEFTGGVEGATTAKFMNFGSAQESVNTLVDRWYKDYGNYKGVNRASSAQDAARQLQQQGYATDPNYASKLKKIMKQNASVVNRRGGSGGKYSYGSGSVVEYLTGDRSHPNFEYNGHGRESNYHEHIAFRTLQDKERAKAALRAAGIQIGSEYRPGDPGWHGANLAIDVPGAQWGGSGAIGQREYNGSAKVRSVLAEAGFSGSGIGQMTTRGSVSSLPMVSPDLGYPQGSEQAPIIIIDEEAPQPVQSAQMQQTPQMIVINPLNRFMKNKMLLDLAYT
jgi:flagellum-specific peptidoglycan hydrolase FlgJ